MNNQDIDELKTLIMARLESAKENGEQITEQDIIEEFGLDDNTVKEINAGTNPWAQIYPGFLS